MSILGSTQLKGPPDLDNPRHGTGHSGYWFGILMVTEIDTRPLSAMTVSIQSRCWVKNVGDPQGPVFRDI